MIEDRRRGGRGVGKGCDVVDPQHEAVVHIAYTDGVLVELVQDEIPTSCSRQHPVRRQLDIGGAENTLPARQESDLGLRSIVAIQQAERKAIEIGPGFSLEALDASCPLVESRA